MKTSEANMTLSAMLYLCPELKTQADFPEK
jgi:hypothetical protein